MLIRISVHLLHIIKGAQEQTRATVLSSQQVQVTATVCALDVARREEQAVRGRAGGAGDARDLVWGRVARDFGVERGWAVRLGEARRL